MPLSFLGQSNSPSVQPLDAEALESLRKARADFANSDRVGVAGGPAVLPDTPEFNQNLQKLYSNKVRDSLAGKATPEQIEFFTNEPFDSGLKKHYRDTGTASKMLATGVDSAMWVSRGLGRLGSAIGEGVGILDEGATNEMRKERAFQQIKEGAREDTMGGAAKWTARIAGGLVDPVLLPTLGAGTALAPAKVGARAAITEAAKVGAEQVAKGALEAGAESAAKGGLRSLLNKSAAGEAVNALGGRLDALGEAVASKVPGTSRTVAGIVEPTRFGRVVSGATKGVVEGGVIGGAAGAAGTPEDPLGGALQGATQGAVFGGGLAGLGSSIGKSPIRRQIEGEFPALRSEVEASAMHEAASAPLDAPRPAMERLKKLDDWYEQFGGKSQDSVRSDVELASALAPDSAPVQSWEAMKEVPKPIESGQLQKETPSLGMRIATKLGMNSLLSNKLNTFARPASQLMQEELMKSEAAGAHFDAAIRQAFQSMKPLIEWSKANKDPLDIAGQHLNAIGDTGHLASLRKLVESAQGVPDDLRRKYLAGFDQMQQARNDLAAIATGSGKRVVPRATPEGTELFNRAWGLDADRQIAALADEANALRSVAEGDSPAAAEAAKARLAEIAATQDKLRMQAEEARANTHDTAKSLANELTDDEVMPRYPESAKRDAYREFHSENRKSLDESVNPYTDAILQFAEDNTGKRYDTLADVPPEVRTMALQDIQSGKIDPTSGLDTLGGSRSQRRITDPDAMARERAAGLMMSPEDALVKWGHRTLRQASVMRMAQRVAPDKFIMALRDGRIPTLLAELPSTIATRFVVGADNQKVVADALNGFLNHHYLRPAGESIHRSLARSAAAIIMANPRSLLKNMSDQTSIAMQVDPKAYVKGLIDAIGGKSAQNIASTMDVEGLVRELGHLQEGASLTTLQRIMAYPHVRFNRFSTRVAENAFNAHFSEGLANKAPAILAELDRAVLSGGTRDAIEKGLLSKATPESRAFIMHYIDRVQPTSKLSFHALDAGSQEEWTRAYILPLRRYMLNRLGVVTDLVNRQVAANIAKKDYVTAGKGIAHLAAWTAIVGGAEAFLTSLIAPLGPAWWTKDAKKERQHDTYGKLALRAAVLSTGLGIDPARLEQQPGQTIAQQFAPAVLGPVASVASDVKNVSQRVSRSDAAYKKSKSREAGTYATPLIPWVGQPAAALIQRKFRNSQTPTSGPEVYPLPGGIPIRRRN